MVLPDLNKQVGPLPLWGWGVALAGGLGLAFLGRRALSSSSSSDTPAPPSVDPGLPASDPRGAVVLNGGTLVDATPAGPTTNDEWRALVTRRLVSEGMGALATDTALGRYLAGMTLDTQQRNIVDRALALFGPPPDGAPVTPAPSTPPVTPVPEPTPPGEKSVRDLTRARLLHHGAAAHRDTNDPTRFAPMEIDREWVRRAKTGDTAYSVNSPDLARYPRFQRGVVLAALGAGVVPA